MIWRRILPSQGGGDARRWWRFQYAVLEKMRDTEHLLKGPVPLFDFSSRNDQVDATNPIDRLSPPGQVGAWSVSDDSVIGGFSTSKLELVRTEADLARVERGQSPINLFRVLEREEQERSDKEENGEGEEEELEDPDSFVPFLRWSGTINTEIGEDEEAIRSGFCAIRSPLYIFDGANIGFKYNSLEILCRTDGREYTFNLKIRSFFPGELYQLPIKVKPFHEDTNAIFPRDKTKGSFQRMIIPFKDFLLTQKGRVLATQRVLDGAIQMENFGITLMDNVDGDFQFDLARIRVVNYFDGELWGEEDEDAPY